MARADLKTKPEWLHQQELRAARRKSASHRNPTRPEQDSVVATEVRAFRLVLAKDASRRTAYEALRQSETLRTYFRKFRYHDPRQLACQTGELALGELPFGVGRKILSELAPTWQQGKLDS